MTIILLFTLLLILVIIQLIEHGDILSPSSLLSISFIISVLVVVINGSKWGYDYSGASMFVVISTIIVFFMGELFSKSLKIESNLSINIDYKILKIKYPVLIILIMLIILFLDYYEVVKSNSFSIQNIGSALSSMRSELGDGETKGLIGRLVPINKAIAYIAIYIIMHNFILIKKYPSFIEVLPILIFICNGFLTTGRTTFLRLIIYIVILASILVNIKYNYSFSAKKQIIKIALISFLAFFVIFIFSGRLLGKGLYNTPFEYFSYYTGSSIYLFNNYVNENGLTSNSEFFGYNTLYTLHNFLRKLGFSDIPSNSLPLEMQYIPHFYSNLYTANRRYLQDFGFFGMTIIQFLMGFFYGRFYYLVKKYRKTNFSLVLYSAICYPLIEFAIEERFFTNLLTFTNLYWLFILWLSYHLIIEEKENPI